MAHPIIKDEAELITYFHPWKYDVLYNSHILSMRLSIMTNNQLEKVNN